MQEFKKYRTYEYKKLPEFFIAFLTEKRRYGVGLFRRSDITGAAAENMGREWVPFEIDQAYLAASAFRFIEGMDGEDARRLLRLALCKRCVRNNHSTGNADQTGLETLSG